jgi:hypothetical protein
MKLCVENCLNFGPVNGFSTVTAPAHKELSVKQFLAEKSITEMEHSPYSPDLAPNYFWLFPETKPTLKGRNFQGTEDIQKRGGGRNMTMAQKVIPRREFGNVSACGSIVGLSA